MLGAEHLALPAGGVGGLDLPARLIAGDLGVGGADLTDPGLFVADDVAGELTGERNQVDVADHVIDQPELQCLLGEHEVAREAHLAGAAHADRLRQQHGQTPARHHAHPRVRVTELGELAGDQEVAVEGQLEAPGDGHPVDRADHRLAHRGERASHPVSVGASICTRGTEVAARAAQLLEIETGTERGIAAGEDHHVDLVARVGFAHPLRQQAQHLGGQRVASRRAVEGDGGDSLAHLVEHDVGHGANDCTARRHRASCSPAGDS